MKKINWDFIWGYYLPVSTFSEKSQLLFLRWGWKNVGGTHVWEKSQSWEKTWRWVWVLETFTWWHTLVRKTQIFWEISDLRKSQRWWPRGQEINVCWMTQTTRTPLMEIYYCTSSSSCILLYPAILQKTLVPFSHLKKSLNRWHNQVIF